VLLERHPHRGAHAVPKEGPKVVQFPAPEFKPELPTGGERGPTQALPPVRELITGGTKPPMGHT